MKTKNLLAMMALTCILLSCEKGKEAPSPPNTGGEGGQEVVNDVTTRLTDNNALLTNPGMGWNQMYYTFDDTRVPSGDDIIDVLDWLPCDIVSFRLSWNKIEPEEGEYNWAVIDEVADRWTAAGKRLGFKFYTNFLWDYPNRQATPLWVKDAGAQGVYLDGNDNPDDDSWMANYSDPILLEKLGNFYRAVQNHYSTSNIEFIELGSIGRVGEGHSYQIGVNATEEELKLHIDLLRECFPDTQLIINDDYGAFACSYAKTKGFGVDDHSIGVGSTETSPGRGYNATIIDAFKDASTVISLENDTWKVPNEWYYQQMVEACANYCRVHVRPSALKPETVKPIVDAMTLKMGYRFQFPEITLPETVSQGEEFIIKYSIRNVGVGCCTVECHPRFVFKDANGREIFGITDTDFSGNDLKYGKDELMPERSLSLNAPLSITADNLDLYVCMVDKDDNPIIKLPYNASGASKQYKVVQIGVKK